MCTLPRGGIGLYIPPLSRVHCTVRIFTISMNNSDQVQFTKNIGKSYLRLFDEEGERKRVHFRIFTDPGRTG